MIFQIDGASSNNKGAQLMLYSILEAISNKFSGARVVINNIDVDLNLFKHIKNISIDIVHPNLWQRLVRLTHTHRIIKIILPKVSLYFTKYKATPDTDMILDAGGFQFGDTWAHDSYDLLKWGSYLRNSKKNGTKHVFLPQAFGPFDEVVSQKLGSIIIDGASMVYVRDKVSCDYLNKLSPNASNVKLSPDFTSLVEAVKTDISEKCKGKVCLIPNSKMISQGVVSESQFINAFTVFATYIINSGRDVFLLNHEGPHDLQLCEQIAERVENAKILIYTGLNALETKGIIGSAYLVISSRFHGVANSLNTGVPCLATSWSHKYKMLLEDYNQNDSVLDINDTDGSIKKIAEYLDETTNAQIREVLTTSKTKESKKAIEMWKEIWALLEN